VYIVWYRSIHDYLESSINPFWGRYVTQTLNPRLVLRFSAGCESNRLGSWHFAGGRIITDHPPLHSVSMPGPGPHRCRQVIIFS